MELAVGEKVVLFAMAVVGLVWWLQDVRGASILSPARTLPFSPSECWASATPDHERLFVTPFLDKAPSVGWSRKQVEEALGL